MSLPEKIDITLEKILEIRKLERDRDPNNPMIKKIDDLLKSFREMKSKNDCLKRKNVIQKIYKIII